MDFEKLIPASEILKNPDLMDDVEAAYVLVEADVAFWGPQNENVVKVMNLMHKRGWETVNITFISIRMVALLLNPRANPKYQPKQE